jgi:transcriptional regulator with PAS, ATPase and Fis domain
MYCFLAKEVVARLIHAYSIRSQQAFVPVNCAALPENLLGSELFGHERGAFTGAISAKQGLFEFAHNGTIFLDEICEMSLGMQAELLRFLEDLNFRRVGGNKLRHADVRIISATNSSPQIAIEQKKLREDLYYRISVVNIHIPPLRARREDIPELIRYYLRKVCMENDIEIKEIKKDVFDVLLDYHWPGNVRELGNLVKKLVYLSRQSMIMLEDLPEDICKTATSADRSQKQLEPYKFEKEKHIREFETVYFQRILAESNGNLTRAAQMAKISRKTLYNILHKLNFLPLENRITAKSH